MFEPEETNSPPQVRLQLLVMLHTLNDMRDHEELCDVVLRAGAMKFPAHKAVLAAVSPFFRTIFLSTFEDAHQKEIEINEAEPETLKVVLDFIYTAKLKECADMILVLELAEFLQIGPLKSVCSEYLKQHLNISNCERIYKTAETLELQELYEAAKRLVMRRTIGEFDVEVHESPENLEEQVLLVAGGSDWLGESLRSAECLAKHAGSTRWRHTRPPSGDVEKPSDTLSVMTEARVGPAFASSLSSLYVIGGKQNAGFFLSSVERFCLTDNRWHQLAPLPVRLSGAAAALVNGRIWVIGGRTNQDWDDRVWIYNMEMDRWHQGPKLPEKRVNHAVVSWHNSIYVLGGKTEVDVVASSSVLVLQSGASEWLEVAPMQRPRAHFGCTVAHGCIYVVGGVDGLHTLPHAERYDLVRDQWRTIANYSVPVEGCRAATLVSAGGDETVLCVGGNDGAVSVNRVERLGITLSEWHCVPELNTPRSHFALAVFPRYV